MNIGLEKLIEISWKNFYVFLMLWLGQRFGERVGPSGFHFTFLGSVETFLLR